MDGEGVGHMWRFAQCFGDKGEVDDITEGTLFISIPRFCMLRYCPDLLSLDQPISFRRWSSIIPGVISRQATRAVEWSSSSGMRWCVSRGPQEPTYNSFDPYSSRRRVASTGFTPSSNLMNQSSIT